MRRYAPTSLRGPSMGATLTTATSGLGRARAASVLSASTMSVASSASRSVRTRRDEGADEKHLPDLPLYEYGDPTAPYSSAPFENMLESSAAKHLRVIDQETLDSVRRVEREAGKSLLSVAHSLMSVNGANVLLLASGRGRTVLDFARSGPASLTIVDLDDEVVAGAANMVRSSGLDAATEVVPICDDAWAFVRDDANFYDLIVCVHSIGQIIKGDPGGVDEFVADVAARLSPGGVLVVDEHVGYTDVAGPGVSSVGEAAYRYVATGLGGFPDDVNYLLPRNVPGCVRRCEWITPGDAHPAQVWRYFAHEKRDDYDWSGVPDVVPSLDCRGLRPMPSWGPSDTEGVFDLLYPALARGHKVPVSRDDSRSVHPSRMMPKLDGEPAIVAVDGDVLTCIGPSNSGVFRLPGMATLPFHCTGEVCPLSSGGYALFITGLLMRGGRVMDPASDANLRFVRQLVKGFETVGVLVNSPALVPCTTGNRVNLPRAPNGAFVPTDGVNVCMGSRWGKFFKPTTTLSVDVTPESLVRSALDLRETISQFRPFGSTLMPAVPLPGEGVSEVGIDVSGLSAKLRFMRPRPDKDKADGSGKMIVFMSSVQRACAVGGDARDTRTMMNFLNTG
ncbi:putative methyltransferase [Colletotrichum camelliae filamentous virus 1]|uniref:Putative methyltransferase n=1 Tax=Colletotrichum camelliae filamentous virus 1 TaxID=2029458 RepID=A0A286M3N0_9VIRU|nr:putative methyltransferase [Colletotrichum camelliae filamentous virus 1]ASV63094.1 putative methyltransferase [Colletotrichum camelliae filamentous virus 1]